MADGNVNVAGTGSTAVDVEVVTTTSGTENRQRVVVAGRAGGEVAEVKNADQPSSSLYGALVRLIGRVWPSYCNSAPVASTVSVSTTAAALPSSPASNRRRIVLKNKDLNNSVAIGGSAVTNNGSSTDGMPLDAGQSMSLDVGPGAVVYGICASGQSANVAVLELVE